MIRPLNRRQSKSEGQQFGPPVKVELPKEIWVDILSKLNLEDLGQCRQVNKKFINQITAYVAKGSKEDNNHWLFNRIASYSEITLKKENSGGKSNKQEDG